MALYDNLGSGYPMLLNPKFDNKINLEPLAMGARARSEANASTQKKLDALNTIEIEGFDDKIKALPGDVQYLSDNLKNQQNKIRSGMQSAGGAMQFKNSPEGRKALNEYGNSVYDLRLAADKFDEWKSNKDKSKTEQIESAPYINPDNNLPEFVEYRPGKIRPLTNDEHLSRVEQSIPNKQNFGKKDATVLSGEEKDFKSWLDSSLSRVGKSDWAFNKPEGHSSGQDVEGTLYDMYTSVKNSGHSNIVQLKSDARILLNQMGQKEKTGLVRGFSDKVAKGEIQVSDVGGSDWDDKLLKYTVSQIDAAVNGESGYLVDSGGGETFDNSRHYATAAKPHGKNSSDPKYKVNEVAALLSFDPAMWREDKSFPGVEVTGKADANGEKDVFLLKAGIKDPETGKLIPTGISKVSDLSPYILAQDKKISDAKFDTKSDDVPGADPTLFGTGGIAIGSSGNVFNLQDLKAHGAKITAQKNEFTIINKPTTDDPSNESVNSSLGTKWDVIATRTTKGVVVKDPDVYDKDNKLVRKGLPKAMFRPGSEANHPARVYQKYTITIPDDVTGGGVVFGSPELPVWMRDSKTGRAKIADPTSTFSDTPSESGEAAGFHQVEKGRLGFSSGQNQTSHDVWIEVNPSDANNPSMAGSAEMGAALEQSATERENFIKYLNTIQTR
jgi:hypothetical protein